MYFPKNVNKREMKTKAGKVSLFASNEGFKIVVEEVSQEKQLDLC